MIVRESLGFTRGGDVKTEIGIGREKLIGDFVKEVSQVKTASSRDFPLDPTKKNDVLTKAALLGRADIVRLLLSDPEANPAYRKNSIIATAALSGSVETVDVLLKDSRVNPADNHNEALYQAAKHNSLDVVRRLMEDPRVNPADGKETLDKDFNVVQEDNYIILEAAANQNFEVVKELMKDPRVKIKRTLQLLVSKISKLPRNQAAIDKWTPMIEYILSSHKIQEELTDKEIAKFKEKINKV
jgi:ankyrin repeat protein